MSWNIRRPNVNLRVTKFAPDTAPIVQSAEMRDALDAHKERRAKEQTKVEPAIELDAVDAGWDEPETYNDYTADWRSDYARDVGMPLREKIR